MSPVVHLGYDIFLCLPTFQALECHLGAFKSHAQVPPQTSLVRLAGVQRFEIGERRAQEARSHLSGCWFWMPVGVI